MSGQTPLPTEDDLKRLPLLAIVAYTVRGAMRVQPLYRLAWGITDFAKHEAAVEQAISVAVRFCLGDDVRAVVDAACNGAFSAAGAASHEAAKAAALAASRAAANAAIKSVGRLTNRAAINADAVCVADAQGERGVRTDYDRLLELNLGDYPDLGDPIDPTETGPLGALWPEGAPEWFTDPATYKPPSEPKRADEIGLDMIDPD